MKYVYFVNSIDDIKEDFIRIYIGKKWDVHLVCENDKDRMGLIRDLNLTIATAISADVSRREKDFVINLCTRFINDLVEDYFKCIDMENNM